MMQKKIWAWRLQEKNRPQRSIKTINTIKAEAFNLGFVEKRKNGNELEVSRTCWRVWWQVAVLEQGADSLVWSLWQAFSGFFFFCSTPLSRRLLPSWHILTRVSIWMPWTKACNTAPHPSWWNKVCGVLAWSDLRVVKSTCHTCCR